MKRNYRRRTLSIMLPALMVVSAARGDWPVAIEPQHRPGTYWWCPGSAWDEESIDWNLTQLRDGGIGTVLIIPIYGARGYEDREISYLSDRWVEMLELILKRAAALGLQVDMTTGTGWCFGGPMVGDPALADQVATYDPATGEYKGNWTPALPDEFQRRRGYELTPHLGALFTETSETAARVKSDYRRTVAELHCEVIEQWTAWAHQRGMLTRNEAHGSPSNLLDVYAAADISETEMFGSPEFPIPGFRAEPQWCRPGDTDPRIGMLAASAAHVTKPSGAQLVASESCTWMREHWHGTLAQIKLEMDLFFLAGVNHVFYHGSCYSPKDAPWPGFYFYASTKAD